MTYITNSESHSLFFCNLIFYITITNDNKAFLQFIKRGKVL